MQWIYNYIPATNHVYIVQCCRCSVFTISNSCNFISSVKYALDFYMFTSRSLCAVPNMAGFCSSLISCFPGVLLRYRANDFEVVSVNPIITGITFAFAFHMRCISIMSYSYIKFFSACFLITFLPPGIAEFINMHVTCLLPWTLISGVLSRKVLSVCTCLFQNMVNLISWPFYTNFCTWSHNCLLYNFRTYVIVQFSTHCIVSLYILFFSQYSSSYKVLQPI